MKKCPRCNETLDGITFEELPVDQCPQGHGSWFDQEELDQALTKAEPDLGFIEVELWKDPQSLAASHTGGPCPVCGEKMALVTYGDTGVEVDVCLQKHGAWLDSGEFEKIAQSLEDQLLTMDSGELLKETLDEGADTITGSEGRGKQWRNFKNVARLLQYRILIENPTLDNMFTGFMRTKSGV